MAKQTTFSFPALLRVSSRVKPLGELVAEAVAGGMPIRLAAVDEMLSGSDNDAHTEIEDASAIDPSLAAEPASAPVAPPQSGTSYAGLSPAQRHAFLEWSRKPEAPAPAAFQQLLLANLEARLLEEIYRQDALDKLVALGTEAAWAHQPALHRTYLLACWMLQDGARLGDWISGRSLPAELLGLAFGLQALIGTPLTPFELGTAIATWRLGARLPADLLKLRLDSLTAILGQAPLAYALAQLDPSALIARPWRTAHRGLRLLIPQPDLRPLLEPSLRDLLAVADVNDDESAPIGTLDALAGTPAPTPPAEGEEQPSMEELGWRLILEFGSNRSEYFDYVLIQAQKLTGYSQLMDEDRRIIYRIIFRKSEMRRFWRIWDYVHGWTSTRVYLNGEELEKWKVWPYSQYLR